MLSEERVVLHRLNSAATLIQRTTTEAPRLHMYYIGLDVHKSVCSLPVPECHILYTDISIERQQNLSKTFAPDVIGILRFSSS